MSGTSHKGKFVVRRHPVVVDLAGCGCRGRSSSSKSGDHRPKIPFFIDLFKTQKPRNSVSSLAPTITTNETAISTWPSTSSSTCETPKKQSTERSSGAKNKKAETEGVGVAVEKESSDPYADFKESMRQMVEEMEMVEWEELRGLLRRFLALNSPRHHHVILRAFAEIWAEVVSPPPVASGSASPASNASAR